MAAIKGQNIRLFLGDKCVAASTSCQLHIAAQIESRTTKDSPEGFDENECTGKSWDASIDALVVEREKTVVSENNTITFSGNTSQSITLAPLSGVTIKYSGSTTTATAHVIVNGGTKGVVGYGKDFTYFNLSDQNETLQLDKQSAATGTGYKYDELTTTATQTVENLISKLGNERLLLKFAITTGTNHRTESTVLKQGYCYLTDLSITAGNKQNSTYTAQLTGDGELTTPV